MEIEYSLVHLKQRTQINRFAEKERETLLLRVDGEFFLNYHPWGEFGDLNCQEFLNQYIKKKQLPPFMQELFYLEKKRKVVAHKSFFNHSFGEESEKIPFTKIKYLGDLNSLIEKIKQAKTKLRIDFNLALTRDQFNSFLAELGQELIKKIDYFEDPYILDENQKALPIYENLIACDRDSYCPKIHSFRIFKPNIDNFNFEKNFFVSSYMGHDLGIYHCYLFLLEYGNLNLHHGIVTPKVYSQSSDLFLNNGFEFMINVKAVEFLYKSLQEINWTKI